MVVVGDEPPVPAVALPAADGAGPGDLGDLPDVREQRLYLVGGVHREVAAPLGAAVALVLGDVAAGPGPAQSAEGGVQVLLVLLNGQDVVGTELRDGEFRELALRVQCIGADDPPGGGGAAG